MNNALKQGLSTMFQKNSKRVSSLRKLVLSSCDDSLQYSHLQLVLFIQVLIKFILATIQNIGNDAKHWHSLHFLSYDKETLHVEELLTLLDCGEEKYENHELRMEGSDYEFSDNEDNVDEDIPLQGRYDNYHAKT